MAKSHIGHLCDNPLTIRPAPATASPAKARIQSVPGGRPHPNPQGDLCVTQFRDRRKLEKYRVCFWIPSFRSSPEWTDSPNPLSARSERGLFKGLRRRESRNANDRDCCWLRRFLDSGADFEVQSRNPPANFFPEARFSRLPARARKLS